VFLIRTRTPWWRRHSLRCWLRAGHDTDEFKKEFGSMKCWVMIVWVMKRTTKFKMRKSGTAHEFKALFFFFIFSLFLHREASAAKPYSSFPPPGFSTVSIWEFITCSVAMSQHRPSRRLVSYDTLTAGQDILGLVVNAKLECHQHRRSRISLYRSDCVEWEETFIAKRQVAEQTIDGMA
jgi:hypothetical protein